ncbi:Uncharacterized protein Rs2_38510 [Raphanus sativus]|nr:Uncharacterized protein Rs2_38510 [Raphanus sativus]
MPNSTPTIEPTFPPHEEVFLSNAPIVETPPLEPTVLEEDELALAVKAVFELSICERRQVPTVEEVPMSWLNLLAQEVEKATRCELVVEEVDEVNNCRVIAIWVKPKVYFLPFEDVTDTQAGKTSEP